MNKADVVKSVLGSRSNIPQKNTVGQAFAPTNIALCKYWGKRNQVLNLPVTSSLSISLGNKGASVELTLSAEKHDVFTLNNEQVDMSSGFAKRLIAFLDLFRTEEKQYFSAVIHSTVPIAAGLASSACGFASIVKALNDLFGWQLAERELSILARLGSGSASRSIWQGFVEWHAGVSADGMDSFAEPITSMWSDLRIGLLIMDAGKKAISSREAMQRTVETSSLYTAWPTQVEHDLRLIKEAIQNQDFHLLGQTAEANAMAMHATMLSAWPPITYALPETLTTMQTIWRLRKEGLPLYFTQDAGPNLKLLFQAKDEKQVRAAFPSVDIVTPF